MSASARAEYRVHLSAFAQARRVVESTDLTTVPEEERRTYALGRTGTLLFVAGNIGSMSGLAVAAALTLLARRSPSAKTLVLPYRTLAGLATGVCAGVVSYRSAPSWGMLDGVHGQLFASGTDVGGEMRRAYSEAWAALAPAAPLSPFLDVAARLAGSPGGAVDSAVAYKVTRFALLAPFAPDPSGTTTLRDRVQRLKLSLPPQLVPVDLLEQVTRAAERAGVAGGAGGGTAPPPAAVSTRAGAAPTPSAGRRSAATPAAPRPVEEAGWDAPPPLDLGMGGGEWDPYAPGGSKGGVPVRGGGGAVEDAAQQPAQADARPAGEGSTGARTPPGAAPAVSGSAHPSPPPEEDVDDALASLLVPDRGGAGRGGKGHSKGGVTDGGDTQPMPSWELRRRRREQMVGR